MLPPIFALFISMLPRTKDDLISKSLAIMMPGATNAMPPECRSFILSGETASDHGGGKVHGALETSVIKVHAVLYICVDTFQGFSSTAAQASPHLV
jgi:hypothetical protein